MDMERAVTQFANTYGHLPSETELELVIHLNRLQKVAYDEGYDAGYKCGLEVATNVQ